MIKNLYFISLFFVFIVIVKSRKNVSEIFIIIGDIFYIIVVLECVCFGEYIWNYNNIYEYWYDVVVCNVV